MKSAILLFITGIFCCFLSRPVQAQKDLRLTSPDGNIVVSVSPKKGQLTYAVAYRGKKMVEPSGLILKFDENTQPSAFKMNKSSSRDTTESYDLIIGKASHIETRYRELTLFMEETASPNRKVNVVFRAFDDGIAFRYEFSGAQNADSFMLADEQTEFRLSGNPLARTLFLPNYTSSHEGFYTSIPLNDIASDTLMDMPTLFEFPGKIYLAITEANLLDYAGMYLTKKDNILRGILSPLPKQPAAKVKARFPHRSSWRVLMIGNRIGTLLETNILTTLSEPNRLKDISWLKPGKTTFPWWNGNVMPDTINAPGNNFVTQKYFIDFCARNKIEYHTVVEYGLHQWYTDDGVGFSPGANNDVTKPVPGLDMKEVCDYARSKGVGVRVWVHWGALYPRLDSAFATWERWGLSGMMIDFMDRDDQEMVNMQTEMLEKAAKHKLHVQFHGAYKPTGTSRTYPNEFTREGTLNYEVNKWGAGLPPDHDLNIVFTRLLAGSTDYHLGGFRAVPDSLYRGQYTRPLMLGTRCHMMALYVVFENAQGMVSDYPEAYENEPGFEFVQDVPTTWDETKVLDASVDKYVVIARRKGKDWYIGAISNHEKRQLDIPLSFLPAGSFSADVYMDTEDAGRFPNKINKQSKTMTKADRISLRLAANGGAAIRLKMQ